MPLLLLTPRPTLVPQCLQGGVLEPGILGNGVHVLEFEVLLLLSPSGLHLVGVLGLADRCCAWVLTDIAAPSSPPSILSMTPLSEKNVNC